jgi:hypothetical protein
MSALMGESMFQSIDSRYRQILLVLPTANLKPDLGPAMARCDLF